MQSNGLNEKHFLLKKKLLYSKLSKKSKAFVKIMSKHPDWLMAGSLVVDAKTEETAGHVEKLLAFKNDRVQILVRLNTEYRIRVHLGGRHVPLKIDKGYLYVEQKTNTWKLFKRKYKHWKREQTRTNNLRKLGAIGRNYFEEW